MMYGTMLHELRNGTGQCIIPRVDDKDFDIAVFERHFHVVLGMKDDIMEKFGWQMSDINMERLFLQIHPPQQKIGKGFQIDVYGFKCDIRNQLVFFSWDHVALRMQDVLPLSRHKTVPIPASVADKLQSNNQLQVVPALRRPFNAPCIMKSLYGPGYMQPTERGNYFLNKR
eukprot:14606683-Ditylum_brightwellii.AAC.1